MFHRGSNMGKTLMTRISQEVLVSGSQKVSMLTIVDQRELRAVLSPGSPRRTSFNWRPEQIRRWSNPDPHPLGTGEGPWAENTAITGGEPEGQAAAPPMTARETTANHSGLTLPPPCTPLSSGTTITLLGLGEEARPYVLRRGNAN